VPTQTHQVPSLRFLPYGPVGNFLKIVFLVLKILLAQSQDEIFNDFFGIQTQRQSKESSSIPIQSRENPDKQSPPQSLPGSPTEEIKSTEPLASRRFAG
jgi:hypothetical protein